MSTQLVVKDFLLDQLKDKLSYDEKKRVEQGLELDFIRAKRDALKRRERSSKVWLGGALLYMVATSIVWGMMSGWTNIWLSAAIALSVFGTVWAGLVHYLDVQKTINALDHAESLLSGE